MTIEDDIALLNARQTNKGLARKPGQSDVEKSARRPKSSFWQKEQNAIFHADSSSHEESRLQGGSHD
jgi:hypothetical protein